ncbi:hypothetical protein llap_20335 [Limosa lapponica baueri]|uniref:Uncharacterized protein n=1 Tax=Limosa lapponica baueri TaxID=1758121 RepID=A0A2I0T6D4_LIMLA|nr:hypothetical protein llap_20335 [Limosa lapponica baueri]
MYGEESKFDHGGKLQRSCLRTSALVWLNLWQTRRSLLQKLRGVVVCGLNVIASLTQKLSDLVFTYLEMMAIEMVCTHHVLPKLLDYGCPGMFRLAV